MHSETPRINKQGLFRGNDQFYEDAFSRSSISDSDSEYKSESQMTEMERDESIDLESKYGKE